MLRALLLITFYAFALTLLAQNKDFTCPWNEVNCPGKCGRFFDADGDGFCDYGRVEKPTDTIKKDEKNISKESNIKPTKDKTQTNKTNNQNPDFSFDRFSFISSLNKSCLRPLPEAVTKPQKRRYNFFLIAGIVTAGYLFSSWLVFKGKIKKHQHFKFWNLMLLLTFLVSGILGFLLVFQINYNWQLGWIKDFLYYHVQFGIAMGWISIFHIWWHRKYFLAYFRKSSG